ncbi:MAG: hypothetical protein EJNHJLOP_00025 [Methanophagales virus PBV082]|uniref:C2H2-type domain-containing protein n=1 Tax=Methanophagales virus PBV082 TaxID=3071307 RepID=A0AA46TDP9_9VIRU|nr:MAG: hypothetical protein QIT52_gp25 [Methanophagales virus PBV082]UYL64914.1 MAG: hypothetical protein EJNHJLOP_00025 [Methanophagales virus PBV082]
MTKVVCDICGKEIDKRAIHLHMRIHEKEKGGVIEDGKLFSYHVLFPDLYCVVKEGSDIHTTPVLALHISSKGGWMIVCDKDGRLMRSEDIDGECYICSGRKEVQKLLKILRKSEGQRKGLFAKVKERMKSRRAKQRQEEERSELSEKSVAELISALKEFAKTRKEGEEENEF